MTASDRLAKAGRFKPVKENTSPRTGAQTMGFLIECHSAESITFQAKPLRALFPLASSIIKVIGETVMEPIARETATVTVARGPKTEANNGSPTAAELGKPRVKASTALSEAFICCSFSRAQKKLIAYKAMYTITNTRAGAACSRKSSSDVLATARNSEHGMAKLMTKVMSDCTFWLSITRHFPARKPSSRPAKMGTSAFASNAVIRLYSWLVPFALHARAGEQPGLAHLTCTVGASPAAEIPRPGARIGHGVNQFLLNLSDGRG